MVESEDGHLISTKQELTRIISQKHRHLHKLKEQQAAFGLHTPPYVLIEIEDLEAEIEDLQTELESPSNGQDSRSGWQALVIDADNHWREIIATNITLLGGTAVDYQVIPTEEQHQLIEACAVAIVGALTPTDAGTAPNEWIKRVIQLGRHLPIILLTGWNDRDVAITLRHTLRNDTNDVTITTIFKENFDAHWFSQVIHQILAR